MIYSPRLSPLSLAVSLGGIHGIKLQIGVDYKLKAAEAKAVKISSQPQTQPQAGSDKPPTCPALDFRKIKLPEPPSHANTASVFDSKTLPKPPTCANSNTASDFSSLTLPKPPSCSITAESDLNSIVLDLKPHETAVEPETKDESDSGSTSERDYGSVKSSTSSIAASDINLVEEELENQCHHDTTESAPITSKSA